MNTSSNVANQTSSYYSSSESEEENTSSENEDIQSTRVQQSSNSSSSGFSDEERDDIRPDGGTPSSLWGRICDNLTHFPDQAINLANNLICSDEMRFILNVAAITLGTYALKIKCASCFMGVLASVLYGAIRFANPQIAKAFFFASLPASFLYGMMFGNNPNQLIFRYLMQIVVLETAQHLLNYDPPAPVNNDLNFFDKVISNRVLTLAINIASLMAGAHISRPICAPLLVGALAGAFSQLAPSFAPQFPFITSVASLIASFLSGIIGGNNWFQLITGYILTTMVAILAKL